MSPGAPKSPNPRYRLVACQGPTGGAAECLSLEQLDVEVPTLTIEGLSVEDAVIRVDRVKAEPTVSPSGAFTYASGDIEATLSVDVGSSRFTIPRENSQPVTGSLNPLTNSFSISDLTFNYDDSLIDATLEVDVVGDYVNRAPRAGFTVSSEPETCSNPVVFTQSSVDLDGDSMTHHWTILGTGEHGSGNQFSIVLGAGDHQLVMWSSDGEGVDFHRLNYTRRCE